MSGDHNMYCSANQPEDDGRREESLGAEVARLRPLERVIAEQQATIDHCLAMHESNAKAWDARNKLMEAAFELLARGLHLDYNDKEKHRDMKYAIRQFFLDNNFCMSCERFICECEYDE